MVLRINYSYFIICYDTTVLRACPTVLNIWLLRGSLNFYKVVNHSCCDVCAFVFATLQTRLSSDELS